MKRLLLLVVVGVVGYFGLKFASGYSLAKQISVCATQFAWGDRLKAARSDAEKREVTLRVFDCTAQKIAFPGSLMFDREAVKAGMLKQALDTTFE